MVYIDPVSFIILVMYQLLGLWDPAGLGSSSDGILGCQRVNAKPGEHQNHEFVQGRLSEGLISAWYHDVSRDVSSN